MRNIIIVLFLCIESFFCLNNAQNNQKQCEYFIHKATLSLNEYYADSSVCHLDTAFEYINTADQMCTAHIPQIVNLKITLFLLSKKYDEGYEYISSLPLDRFKRSYQKNQYLNTFKALLYEQNNDTINRNACYKAVAVEIEKYLENNPSNKDALVDLFFAKIKFENKDSVLNQINIIEMKNNKDKNFYEALKETIGQCR